MLPCSPLNSSLIDWSDERIHLRGVAVAKSVTRGRKEPRPTVCPPSKSKRLVARIVKSLEQFIGVHSWFKMENAGTAEPDEFSPPLA